MFAAPVEENNNPPFATAPIEEKAVAEPSPFAESPIKNRVVEPSAIVAPVESAPSSGVDGATVVAASEEIKEVKPAASANVVNVKKASKGPVRVSGKALRAQGGMGGSGSGLFDTPSPFGASPFDGPSSAPAPTTGNTGTSGAKKVNSTRVTGGGMFGGNSDSTSSDPFASTPPGGASSSNRAPVGPTTSSRPARASGASQATGGSSGGGLFSSDGPASAAAHDPFASPPINNVNGVTGMQAPVGPSSNPSLPGPSSRSSRMEGTNQQKSGNGSASASNSLFGAPSNNQGAADLFAQPAKVQQQQAPQDPSLPPAAPGVSRARAKSTKPAANPYPNDNNSSGQATQNALNAPLVDGSGSDLFAGGAPSGGVPHSPHSVSPVPTQTKSKGKAPPPVVTRKKEIPKGMILSPHGLISDPALKRQQQTPTPGIDKSKLGAAGSTGTPEIADTATSVGGAGAGSDFFSSSPVDLTQKVSEKSPIKGGLTPVQGALRSDSTTSTANTEAEMSDVDLSSPLPAPTSENAATVALSRSSSNSSSSSGAPPSAATRTRPAVGSTTAAPDIRPIKESAKTYARAPHIIAAFGFGGRLVTIAPRRKQNLNTLMQTAEDLANPYLPGGTIEGRNVSSLLNKAAGVGYGNNSGADPFANPQNGGGGANTHKGDPELEAFVELLRAFPQPLCTQPRNEQTREMVRQFLLARQATPLSSCLHSASTDGGQSGGSVSAASEAAEKSASVGLNLASERLLWGALQTVVEAGGISSTAGVSHASSPEHGLVRLLLGMGHAQPTHNNNAQQGVGPYGSSSSSSSAFGPHNAAAVVTADAKALYAAFAKEEEVAAVGVGAGEGGAADGENKDINKDKEQAKAQARAKAKAAKSQKQAKKMPAEEMAVQLEALLLLGQREEACDLAMQQGDWFQALMISSTCAQSKYQQVAKACADETFPQGSPLHTLLLLYSNQAERSFAPAASASRSSPFHPNQASTLNGAEQNKEKTQDQLASSEKQWRRTLSAMLSNKFPDWSRLLRRFGDKVLVDTGDVCAAHVVYVLMLIDL